MKRPFLVVLAVGVAAFGAWKMFGSGTMTPLDDPGLVEGRVWVDSEPKKPTEYVQVAFLIGEAGVGIFERASSYDLRLEIFEYSRDKGSVKLTFPQSGRAAGFDFTVKSCKYLPPFDLCLDLSSNPWGGPRRYYGFVKQEDESSRLGKLADVTRAEAARRGR